MTSSMILPGFKPVTQYTTNTLKTIKELSTSKFNNYLNLWTFMKKVNLLDKPDKIIHCKVTNKIIN